MTENLMLPLKIQRYSDKRPHPHSKLKFAKSQETIDALEMLKLREIMDAAKSVIVALRRDYRYSCAREVDAMQDLIEKFDKQSFMKKHRLLEQEGNPTAIE